jgi:hypothetical protein
MGGQCALRPVRVLRFVVPELALLPADNSRGGVFRGDQQNNDKSYWLRRASNSSITVGLQWISQPGSGTPSSSMNGTVAVLASGHSSAAYSACNTIEIED